MWQLPESPPFKGVNGCKYSVVDDGYEFFSETEQCAQTEKVRM